MKLIVLDLRLRLEKDHEQGLVYVKQQMLQK